MTQPTSTTDTRRDLRREAIAFWLGVIQVQAEVGQRTDLEEQLRWVRGSLAALDRHLAAGTSPMDVGPGPADVVAGSEPARQTTEPPTLLLVDVNGGICSTCGDYAAIKPEHRNCHVGQAQRFARVMLTPRSELDDDAGQAIANLLGLHYAGRSGGAA